MPALEAAGDTAAQVLLLPPKHYRRVLEEAVGEFPKELGGGSMKILTEGVLWAAVGIDLDPRPALRMVIQSEDARGSPCPPRQAGRPDPPGRRVQGDPRVDAQFRRTGRRYRSLKWKATGSSWSWTRRIAASKRPSLS